MRPRPLYEAEAMLPPVDVLTRVRAALEAGGCPCEGHVGRRHLNLHIRADQRHLWSPFICVEVSARDGGSTLRGYFGPHPHLWGIYTAVYATQVFLFIAGAVYGGVCWSLGEPLTGLWVAALMLATLALSCATNIAGEWAGAPQMELTRAFLAETLDLARPGEIHVGTAGPPLHEAD